MMGAPSPSAQRTLHLFLALYSSYLCLSVATFYLAQTALDHSSSTAPGCADLRHVRRTRLELQPQLELVVQDYAL